MTIAPEPTTRRYGYQNGQLSELPACPVYDDPTGNGIAAFMRSASPLTDSEREARDADAKAQRKRQELVNAAVAEAETIIAAAKSALELMALRERIAKLDAAVRDAEAEHAKSLAEFDTLSASVAEAMANGSDYAAIEKKRDKLSGEAVRIATRLGDLRAAVARVRIDLSRQESAIVRDAVRAAYPASDAAVQKAHAEREELAARHRREMADALAVLAAADARLATLKRAAGDDLSVIVTRSVPVESQQTRF